MSCWRCIVLWSCILQNSFYCLLTTIKIQLIIVTLSFNLSEGGTHWALLIYSRGAWFYLDSSAGDSKLIINVATIVQNLKFIIKKGKHKDSTSTLEQSMNDTMKIEYISDAPSQVNSWDCGIYVICFTQAVVERYLSGGLGDLKEQSMAMFAHMNP